MLTLPYLYFVGMQQLAKQLSGEERIYLGVRPYGFHAGNMSSLVVYPMLLCEELQKVGKEPRFTFYLFINDWEQDALDGPDLKKFPFNVFPKKTTLQYTPFKKLLSVVDYWEPVIAAEVRVVEKYFPHVRVRTVRNSSMKHHPIMKAYLLKTLQFPDEIAAILKETSKFDVSGSPLHFAMAVCNACKQARGETRVIGKPRNERIWHFCQYCHTETEGHYEDFDYWFYHKPLAVPRLEIFHIDVCITGNDHLVESDFTVREKLIKLFGALVNPFKTLYGPLVVGANNSKMSKSKKNDVSVGYQTMRQLIEKHKYAEVVKVGMIQNIL